MVRQPCRPQVGLQGGRHTGGGERQATLAPFGGNDGNRCPAVKSHPIRCGAEMYAVTARNVQTAGQSRPASTTTASLEALSV